MPQPVLIDHPFVDTPKRSLPTGTQVSAAKEILHSSSPGQLPTLPGYEVLAELGRGGMGVVWKAHQVSLNRIVALKLIRGQADPNLILRFRAEAEAVARLRHPHVVQVFEAGEWGTDPFFAMEFCPGGTLSSRLSTGPLAPRVAADLSLKLAGGVAAAHRAGVIHRDLKPANVLFDATGEPRVADFGLAKMLDDSAGLTATDQGLGTPSYMAPEQVADARSAGAAADVYALGAVLYECLAGRPPFKGATAYETIRQVIEQDPVPVRRIQPGVPQDLATICMRCLEKNPARRYQTAVALAEDLQRCLEGRPVFARPRPVWDRGLRWARRRPTAAALLILLALLPLLITVAAVVYAGQQRLLAEKQTEVAAERDGLAREKEDLQRQTAARLYRSLLGEASATRMSREVGYRGRVWQLLRQATDLNVPGEDPGEIREQAVACLGDPVGLPPISTAGITRAKSAPLSNSLRDVLRVVRAGRSDPGLENGVERRAGNSRADRPR